MLTPKFRLQDYGATLVALGLFVLFLTLTNFRCPRKKWQVVVIGIAIPFITVAGFVLDLFQGMRRDEFPSWADSLGIPLMGVPVQLVILFLWAMAHLGFLQVGYNGGAPLKYAISHRANWWLLFVSVLTLLLTGLLALEGAYLYAIPGYIWLYFYLSIAAGRRGANATQQVVARDAFSATPSASLQKRP